MQFFEFFYETINDIDRSDVIAILALLFSILSLVYSYRANIESQKANNLAIYPYRLEVYQIMINFSDYCSKYTTRFHMKEVNYSHELKCEIDKFSADLNKKGNLSMPSIDDLCDRMIKSAWKIQRLIDQRRSSTCIGQELDSNDDELMLLTEWFSQLSKTKIKETFNDRLKPFGN